MGMRVRRWAAVGLAGTMITVLSVVAIGGTLTTGVGASTPKLSSDSANIAFGDVIVGSDPGPGAPPIEDIRSFYLTNDTGSTVTVDLSTGVTYSGPGAGDYTLVPSIACSSGGTITLTPDTPCNMEVYFRPSASGDRSARMTIKASDSTMTSVSLSGTGSPTLTAVPASLSFGPGIPTHRRLNRTWHQAATRSLRRCRAGPLRARRNRRGCACRAAADAVMCRRRPCKVM